MAYFDDYLRSEAAGGKCEKLSAVRVAIPAASVVAPDPDGILKTQALPVAAGSVGTFLAQPPYPMTLTLVCSGTQTGKATIYGTDISGAEINEEVTLKSAVAVETTKAFASVGKIALPQKIAAETVDVGWGSKFALPFRLPHTSQVIAMLFDGSADLGTVTASATDLAKNVFDPAGTPDGKKAIEMIVLV